jgi:hypothetical protein
LLGSLLLRRHLQRGSFLGSAQALEEAEEEAKGTEAAAQVLGEKDAPPDADPTDSANPAEMTVAQLQEELSKRGLDTKWNPLKKKKELVDRLQVCALCHLWPATLSVI